MVINVCLIVTNVPFAIKGLGINHGGFNTSIIITHLCVNKKALVVSMIVF
jgi:hypothetical protein